MIDNHHSPPFRKAACRCGQLSAICSGEPVRITACHCLACQQRTGSAFAVQARYRPEDVRIEGQSREWVRTTDSGHETTYHFCPTCGSTVWYQGRPLRDSIAIPVGAFADPGFPPPRFSVWEKRKHSWVTISGDEVEHSE